jgi:hypothetical protein
MREKKNQLALAEATTPEEIESVLPNVADKLFEDYLLSRTTRGAAVSR